MIRHSRLSLVLVTAGLVTAAASGCGDDGGGGGSKSSAGSAGEAGDTGTGGGTTTGGSKSTGGTTSTAGDAGMAGEPQGTGGEPSAGGEPGTSGAAGEGGEPSTTTGGAGGEPSTTAGEGGGGGTVTTTADIDDVVMAVCDWEFSCCDEGERTYRLSPFSTDAAECADRLIFELRQSNATSNPYLSGPAAPGQILGQLGYVVNLSRVEVNEDGAADCVNAWNDRGCAEEPDPDARCEGPTDGDPCALTNLFNPILDIGDECTEALAETGAENDVECVAGSTCLPAAHADNPATVPTCVQRGVEGEPCSNDDDCDFDFYCGAGDCTAKGDVGDACSFEDNDAPLPGEEDAPCKAGLSCHPLDLECVAPCSVGFTCATGVSDADAACPEGTGCAPIEVGESEDDFRVCAPLGSSATDLCNSDADCVSTHYCDVRTCLPKKNSAVACIDDNECMAGLHCDTTCMTNLAAMSTCDEDSDCGPSSAGCLDAGSDGFICRNSLLTNGSPCGTNAACASGLCEYANGSAAETTCVPGGEADDACDTVPADGTAQSCMIGLFCFGESGVGTGTCVPEAGPGMSCIDPDDMPNAVLCANGGTCTDPWDEGEICTDGAVPEVKGGTNLVCDGS